MKYWKDGDLVKAEEMKFMIEHMNKKVSHYCYSKEICISNPSSKERPERRPKLIFVSPCSFLLPQFLETAEQNQGNDESTQKGETETVEGRHHEGRKMVFVKSQLCLMTIQIKRKVY
jgi:hypothetical protein